MAETAEASTTYRGNCHCGAFIFELTIPEVKSAIGCDCSNCSKKAYLWLFVPQDALKIVKDEGILAEYECGPKKSTHKFCSKCGTPVLATNPSYGSGLGVNARAIQNLDPWELVVNMRNGAKIDPQWVPPVYSGAAPTAELGSGSEVTYYGSCRCGAVQAAVKLEGPLNDSYKGSILECNCSSCRRGGFIWIYPKKDQLAFQGAENLTRYAFGNRLWNKAFCKTCGVHFITDLGPQTDEEWNALSEEVKERTAPLRDIRPVNIRMFNHFDPLSVKAVHADGWSRGDPPYVNP